MLVRFFIAVMLILSFAEARTTTEVREGTGVPTIDFNRVDASHLRSKNESRFPFVCYDSRVKVEDDDGIAYLKYKGCNRTTTHCHKFGQEHFGKYPNDYESYQALQRCINSRPKFVD